MAFWMFYRVCSYLLIPNQDTDKLHNTPTFLSTAPFHQALPLLPSPVIQMCPPLVFILLFVFRISGMSTLYLQYFQSFLTLFQLLLSPQLPEIHSAIGNCCC